MYSYSGRHYSYAEILERTWNLKYLSILPAKGESAAQFSSWDPESDYNESTGQFVNWDANKDGARYIREENGGKVIAEMDGPGYISRIWLSDRGELESGRTRIEIYIDGKRVINETALYFFKMFDSGNALSIYASGGGWNSFVPITYNESCKVIVYDYPLGYHQVSYNTLAEGTTVESFKWPLSSENLKALNEAKKKLGANLGNHPYVESADETFKGDITVEKGSEACFFSDSKDNAIVSLKIRVPQDKRDDAEFIDNLVISAIWDGGSEPDICAPLGDFFGSAYACIPYKSAAIGCNDDGWFYSYWYMPYEKGAQLFITNKNEEDCLIEFEVETELLDQPSEILMRYRAVYNRNKSIDKKQDNWPDSLVIDLDGTGRYLGFSLRVTKYSGATDPRSTPGGAWWGEGDEKFYIDGNKECWIGTGTEDYFGYCWGSTDLFTSSYIGQNLCSAGISNGYGNRSLYRTQIIDAIPFHQSFEGYLEKYYSDEYVAFGSVSRWYSRADDRYSVDKSALEGWEYVANGAPVSDYYEGEDLIIKEYSGADLSIQGNLGPTWTNGTHLWFTPKDTGAYFEFYINVPSDGKYKLVVQNTIAFDYGKIQFSIDGVKIDRIYDCYSPNAGVMGEKALANVTMKSGVHVIRVEVVGKNKLSSGYYAGIDYLRVLPEE